MRDATPQLIEHLNTAERFLAADLYTITLLGGTILRWTGCDRDLVVAGETFLSAEETSVPVLTRGRTRLAVGLEVATLDITMGSLGSVLLNGSPLPLAVLNGVFDGARVLLERAYLREDNPDVSRGQLHIFEGRVAGLEPSSMEVKVTVKSELERLNVKLPPHLFMPACRHAVYNPGCGLNRATFTVVGVAAAGSTTTVVLSNRTEANDWFALGVLAFTSGALTGIRRAVRAYAQTAGSFTLALPLPTAPTPGDTFTAYPGCARDRVTCDEKFDNLIHFGGFPYTPPPEQVR